jgi:hypothetical protein
LKIDFVLVFSFSDLRCDTTDKNLGQLEVKKDSTPKYHKDVMIFYSVLWLMPSRYHDVKICGVELDVNIYSTKLNNMDCGANLSIIDHDAHLY